MMKLNPNQMFSKFMNSLSPKNNDEKASQSANGNNKSNNVLPTESVNLLKSSASSFSLFYKSSKEGVQTAFTYSSVQSSTQFNTANSAQEVDDLDEADFEQRDTRASLAASNILGFIGRRLELDKEQGASEEAMQSRLEAGLAGFEKGLKEANQILTDMGLLSEDVEADIALTEEKVRSGIDGFSSLVSGKPPAVDEDDFEDESESALATNTQSIVNSFSESLSSFGASAANRMEPAYSSIASSQSRSFQFELVTQDGDKVSIDASAFQQAYLEQGPGFFSSGVESGSDFGFEITGDLDADEVKAIASLLKDVNQLAGDFYSGDMTKALEKAMNLGFDSSEIGGFALNLSQVTQVKAMQAYQPNEQILKPDVLAELRPLGKFASQVAQMLTRADEQFSHPRELLSELFQKMDEFTLAAQDDEDSVPNSEVATQTSNSQQQISLMAFSQTIIEQWSLRQTGPNEQVAAVSPSSNAEQE